MTSRKLRKWRQPAAFNKSRLHGTTHWHLVLCFCGCWLAFHLGRWSEQTESFASTGTVAFKKPNWTSCGEKVAAIELLLWIPLELESFLRRVAFASRMSGVGRTYPISLRNSLVVSMDFCLSYVWNYIIYYYINIILKRAFTSFLPGVNTKPRGGSLLLYLKKYAVPILQIDTLKKSHAREQMCAYLIIFAQSPTSSLLRAVTSGDIW